MKRALITGITGQDGSYLAELLLEKDYEVYGLQRRSSNPNTFRIEHLLFDPKHSIRFKTIYGDLAESSNISRIVAKLEPDEVYNLGAQSHVGVSFDIPEYTANVTGLGSLRILDAIRDLKIPTKYYQASSSEMFGAVLEIPQTEKTPFNPQSPYGLSKVFSFFATKIYRESYKIFASNGILFNHESPRRGENFVTRKITIGLAKVKLGMAEKVSLGNMDSKRDWGYAKDYVEGIWKILQHHEPGDFVLATGQTHTIREFAEAAGKTLGMDIVWEGKGMEEVGVDRKTGKIVIDVDPQFFRPNEVDFLLGSPKKAKKLLGWKPNVTFRKLAQIMAEADYDLLKKSARIGK